MLDSVSLEKPNINTCSPVLVQRFRTAALVLAVILICISITNILGWVADIDVLKHPFSGAVRMKMNTGICFLLLACSLAFRTFENRWARIASHCLSLSAFAIAGISLFEYATNIDVGIDQLLAVDEHLGEMPSPPGRMAPLTATCFILSAIAISWKRTRFRHACALAVATDGLLALCGYVFEIPKLYQNYGLNSYLEGIFAGIAWVTAICTIIIGVGALFIEPEFAFDGMLCSTTHGGYLLRRLIPGALVMPLIFGWLTSVGERLGWYGSDIRLVIFMVLMMCSIFILIMFISRRLDRLDIARRTIAEQRADVVYSLAHDLKVPLVGAERALELLASGSLGDMSREQQGLIAKLRDSAQDQINALDNIVYEYKLEQGLEKLHRQPTPLAKVTSECLAKLEAQVRSKQLQISLRDQDPEVLSKSDPIAIRRVIYNVLHNAVKFSACGGAIDISIGQQAEDCFITVSDSGKGMTEKQQSRLFQRFWQTEDSGSYSTTGGIGLYICRRIVEAHHGTIKCKSVLGRGSTFTITVPACKEASPVLLTLSAAQDSTA